ncbi:exosortase family protein XrtF [Flavobacterium amniphilum]|uniref:exosortase family protein XrtF n=1 Tax=Flavobacterium amniphilum TaxID=1834035 RepID=UPI00202A7583|nr:exosortase family protein XrtF [Flavobacterium amniphilum]MCL9804691.1 exosortase family protein XrtF [Flavobacterium amniphilum]
MTNYFRQYKPFLSFLGKFFLAYLAMAGVYQWYLSGFGEVKMDHITRMVAWQTEELLQMVSNQPVVVEDNKPDQFIKIIYSGKYVARIIEGCNAISVIILFISFVVAFSGRLKPTVLFIFLGSILIYFLNIFRIAVLTVLVYNFPEQEHFLHGVVFPLMIYGVVFLLWIYWVKKHSQYAAGKSE